MFSCKNGAILILLQLIFLTTPAQDTTNYDKLYEKARKEAFEKKNYGEARVICRKILDKKPQYYDARVLIGNTLAFERKFNDARFEIEKVLEEKPEYHDAIQILLNIEYWSGNLKQALKVADKAILLFPNEYEFKITKAKILDQLELYPEALAILEDLLVPKPKKGGMDTGQLDKLPEEVQEEIKKMIEEIKIKMKKSHIGALYTLELFDKIYAPRHLLEVEFKRKFGKNALILRTSVARRFARQGLQLELDYYRRLGRTSYLYLNAGYSPSSIFPRFRSGAEFYKRLKRNMDASIGARYLYFVGSDSATKQVIIFTGSLGKYYQKYWFGMRPFITPRGTGAALSLLLHARRYFENYDNHLTLTLGYGLTPENRVFLSENTDFYTVTAARAGLNLQRIVAKNYFLFGGLIGERQELSTMPGVYIFDFIFEAGARYRF